MKVLLSWLREFVDVAVSPAELADDLTRAGLAVDALETHEGDTVLDLDITTNRVDCMNVYGVAREVAVLYGAALRPIERSVLEQGAPASAALTVSIEAGDLCPRFAARVLDVRLGPSPAWMRERLERVGQRAINNVVDLTNYVMLEMGQPTHAFDLARVPGARLTARWAREGERVATLDGVERTLGARNGVVASGEAALAVAGVMGGASSEVGDDTRTIALEAAYWDALSIRRSARALGMHTEASHRFERGADPEAPPVALDRVAHLLAKIGAGSARPGVIDVVAVPRAPREVGLRPARVGALLGTDVPPARSREILAGLGFGVASTDGPTWSVRVPSWRGDVAREADLIEEVGRHHGLDRIAPALPPSLGVEGLRPSQRAEREVREALVAASLDEAITLAFVAPDANAAPRLRLQNPLSEEQSVLRTSLLPGLLGVLRTNLRQGRRDVRLFEIGRVFAASGQLLPREERRLAVLLTGAAAATHWSAKPRALDFYDATGMLEAVQARLGWPPLPLSTPADLPAFLHPGKSAAVGSGGTRGFVGALHPDLAAELELRDECVVLELVLDELLAAPAAPVRVRPLPRAPGVARDVSVLVGAEVASREVERWIRGAAGPLLARVAVVDRYDRAPVPAGKVSLTLSLVFQDPGRTLTGEEVESAMASVRNDLGGRGAELRGE